MYNNRMKIQFLGTAAAEGFPGLFCDCETCREARALGGRDLRLRSALMVNDDLLIDFGPDLVASAQRFNRTLHYVRTGLVTHAHEDHFHLLNFKLRGPSFTARQQPPVMTVFGPADVVAMLGEAFPDLAALRLEARSVEPFQTWRDGAYQFTSFQAYHAVGMFQCLFYAVDDGQRSILYATDTGDFPEPTWQALAGRSFDLIVLEETLGSGQYAGHMNIERFIEHVRRFRASAMLRPGGRIVAHHLSHSWNPTFAKVEALLGPHGVEVAYDGMEITL